MRLVSFTLEDNRRSVFVNPEHVVAVEYVSELLTRIVTDDLNFVVLSDINSAVRSLQRGIKQL